MSSIEGRYDRAYQRLLWISNFAYRQGNRATERALSGEDETATERARLLLQAGGLVRMAAAKLKAASELKPRKPFHKPEPEPFEFSLFAS